VVDSQHVASDLMQRVHGPGAAQVATILILWTALASTFAAVLSYSRIPYASARAGHFFRFFAATHPRGEFPHRSLLLVSGMATLACLADLPTVIAALLTSRILVQFVGQIATIVYLRRRPGGWRPTFRMPLYPLPAVVALIGWSFVFATSGWHVIGYGTGSLVVGVLAFWVWDASIRRGPEEIEPILSKPPKDPEIGERP
jgi:amino acid transporter